MATVHCIPFVSDDDLKCIDLFKLVIQTAFGPNGKLKMLQNTCGGHVTITSSSHRLLKTITITNPVNKLIASAATSHLKSHSNDGLYLMLLIVEFFKRAHNLEVQQCLISSVYQTLAQSVISHLKDCSLKRKVDFGELCVLMTLVRSIVKSKPGCGLNEKQHSHISCLLMRGFLHCIPKPNSDRNVVGNLHFASYPGMSPDQCQLFGGVIVETSDSKLIDLPSGKLSCALFHVSLSGDADTDLGIANWTTHSDIDIVGTCSTSILRLCQQLVIEGVAIVGCQKVIHPKAKKYLRDHGLLCIDRLGMLTFNALLELTGASPIETYIEPLDHSCLGIVHRVCFLTLKQKNFYHLQNDSIPVNSLFLYHYHEESLEELVVVCKQVIDALRGLLIFPYVFCGGGCLETHLAAYVRHWGKENLFELTRHGEFGQGQVLSIVEAFAKSLESIPMFLTKPGHEPLVDTKHHCWVSPESDSICNENCKLSCACGLRTKNDFFKNDEDPFLTTLKYISTRASDVEWTENISCDIKPDAFLVFDAALSKAAAIKTALETCVTLLSVDAIIKSCD